MIFNRILMACKCFRAAGLVLLALSAAGAAPRHAPESSAPAPLPAVLSKDGQTVRIGSEELPILLRDQAERTIQGAVVGADGRGLLRLHAATQGVVLRVEGKAGWSAAVPSGGSVTMRWDPQLELLELGIAEANLLPVMVRAGDSLRLEAESGTVRFDFFGTEYRVTGRGRISAIFPDNSRQPLDHRHAPLAGVLDRRDPLGQRMATRVRLEVLAEGVAGVFVGNQIHRLEGRASKRVTGADGSVLETAYDSAAFEWSWRVIKGHFVFENPPAGCWRVAGTAGHSGAIRWNRDGSEVRVENRIPDSSAPLLVSLANGIGAAVARQASIRYQGNDRCRSFSFESGPAEAELFHLTNAEEGRVRGQEGASPFNGNTAVSVDWTLSVPGKQRVDFRVNPVEQWIEAQTPIENNQELRLVLGDGAQAAIGAGSFTRLEMFSDQTYSLAGRGQVQATGVDGQKQALSELLPPLTGGPLVRVPSQTGEARMERKSPAVRVTIDGPPDGPVRVEANGTSLLLPEGEQQWITAANGSRLLLKGSPGTLEWKVDRGLFELGLAAAGDWTLVAQTGQAGSLDWDPAGQAIDLTNPSESERLLVALPNRTYAMVGPRATFQFARVNSATFATAAIGGPVVLFNANTLEETRLDQGNLLFRWGVAVRARQGEPPQNAVRLDWQAGSDLRVQGSLGTVSIPPGSTRVLQSETGSRLQLIYGSQGDLILRALAGNFTLVLQPLEGLTIELPEGNAVSLQLDQRKGIFLTRAAPENTEPIRLLVADGLELPLHAAQSFTLAGRAGGFSALTEGNVVFYEGAGASSTAPFGVAPRSNPLPSPFTGTFGANNNQLDVTRIQQPPVSPIR